MQVVWRFVKVLGLAMATLVVGAMPFDPAEEPAQSSAPPAIATQMLERLG